MLCLWGRAHKVAADLERRAPSQWKAFQRTSSAAAALPGTGNRVCVLGLSYKQETAWTPCAPLSRGADDPHPHKRPALLDTGCTRRTGL